MVVLYNCRAHTESRFFYPESVYLYFNSYCRHLELHNTYTCITKLALSLLFRSVSLSTNTHTGIGTLRNGTKQENIILFTLTFLRISNNRFVFI
jgi:hypothetical protein